jgi:hypothetical protein
MAHDLNDQLERRLLAARPDAAQFDDYMVDSALLERVRKQPIAPRRSIGRTVAAPAAVGVALTATAVVMLAGGPGAGPPSAAAAINQTLHWLSPSAHSVLHARSVETLGDSQTTRELWQSTDNPNLERQRTVGTTTFETAGDGIYDPATDTIYAAPNSPSAIQAADKKKRAQIAAGHAGDGKKAAAEPSGRKPVEVAQADGPPPFNGPEPSVAEDPIVMKVRMLLQDGRMTVRGREMHNGVESWAISLKQGLGDPVWTLWVSAADGKPLELRDPGQHAGDKPQTIRWDAYEVLPDANAQSVVSVQGAHPGARVVTDPAQYAAAEQRLMGKDAG